ncbi:MAG: Rpn family recombination-promoting nuclease/putative transposase [Bacteroidales bacterium]|nr:Rpn family recombination-promoting nuclease/putative transposase [Bacteroidales bacterium]
MLTHNQNSLEQPVRIGRYVNILKDRWFKRTFGWDQAKRLMQLLLQQLIPERSIREVHFGPQEHTNPILRGKDIRVDVQCTDEEGNLFIVEVQLSEQSTFYERAVFNSSFVIQEQLPHGRTDWGFAPIYFIGIVNFSIHKKSEQVLFRYRLREVESGEPMTNRIEYVFLEVPNCKHPEAPDAGALDRLCYTFGHISEMTEQPQWARGEFYDLLFKSAEISNFAPEELKEYIKDMTTERDIKNQIAFAENKGRLEGEQEGERRGKQEGREEGREEALVSTAMNLLRMGMSPDDVSRATGLPLEDIKALRGACS